MKKLFLYLIIFVFPLITMAQSDNNISFSGEYFKADNSSINFYGIKASYLIKTNQNVYWGIFLGAMQGTEKYTETVNTPFTYTEEKDVSINLMKVGAEANFFPGDSKTLFIGAEFFYITLSANSEDITEDGYGISPKVGVVFSREKIYTILEAKYNFLRFTDEDSQVKGFEAEIGFLIPLG